MLTPGPRRLARLAVAAAAITSAAGLPLTVAGPASADQARQRQQWVLNALDVSAAWKTTQGQGVTVAVIDSGVDPAVSDLTGQVTTGPDYTGVHTPSSNPNWGSHGTWMASLIAGHGHGPGDRNGVLGVAPKAHILSVRVITDRTDPGYAAYQAEPAWRGQRELASAIKYAVQHHAGVISMSLGYDAPSGSVRAALQYALRRDVVVVASSGNSGTPHSPQQHGAAPYSFPADYPGVVGVAAVNKAGQAAYFSSENLSVEVAAPGVNVPAQGRGSRYWVVSGTSPACALTAGVAALVRSKYPKLSAIQVREAIISSSTHRPKGGYDDHVGFGTVDAAAALRAASQLGREAPAGQTRAGRRAAAGSFGGGQSGVVAFPVRADGRNRLYLLLGLGAVSLLVLLLALWRLVRRRPPGTWARRAVVPGPAGPGPGAGHGPDFGPAGPDVRYPTQIFPAQPFRQGRPAPGTVGSAAQGYPAAGYPEQPGGYPGQPGDFPGQPADFPGQPGGPGAPVQAGPGMSPAGSLGAGPAAGPGAGPGGAPAAGPGTGPADGAGGFGAGAGYPAAGYASQGYPGPGYPGPGYSGAGFGGQGDPESGSPEPGYQGDGSGAGYPGPGYAGAGWQGAGWQGAGWQGAGAQAAGPEGAGRQAAGPQPAGPRGAGPEPGYQEPAYPAAGYPTQAPAAGYPGQTPAAAGYPGQAPAAGRPGDGSVPPGVTAAPPGQWGQPEHGFHPQLPPGQVHPGLAGPTELLPDTRPPDVGQSVAGQSVAGQSASAPAGGLQPGGLQSGMTQSGITQPGAVRPGLAQPVPGVIDFGLGGPPVMDQIVASRKTSEDSDDWAFEQDDGTRTSAADLPRGPEPRSGPASSFSPPPASSVTQAPPTSSPSALSKPPQSDMDRWLADPLTSPRIPDSVLRGPDSWRASRLGDRLGRTDMTRPFRSPGARPGQPADSGPGLSPADAGSAKAASPGAAAAEVAAAEVAAAEVAAAEVAAAEVAAAEVAAAGAVPAAPRPGAPQPGASGSVAPGSVAPGSVPPGSVAPESVAPESVAPEYFAPGADASSPVAPSSVAPRSADAGPAAAGTIGEGSAESQSPRGPAQLGRPDMSPPRRSGLPRRAPGAQGIGPADRAAPGQPGRGDQTQADPAGPESAGQGSPQPAGPPARSLFEPLHPTAGGQDQQVSGAPGGDWRARTSPQPATFRRWDPADGGPPPVTPGQESGSGASPGTLAAAAAAASRAADTAVWGRRTGNGGASVPGARGASGPAAPASGAG
ncbi:MAG: S8 family serine peptidase, partial [Streptosporangiaceae bacterium]